MKRSLILIAIYLIGSTAFGQTNIFPTSGSAGIGTTLPEALLNIVGTSSTNVELQADHYQNGYGASTIQLKKARGTKIAPIAVLSGDYLSAIEGWAYSGSSFLRSSYIVTIVNGTPTTTAVPTDMIFATRNTEADAIERMRLDKNGNLGIGTSVPTEKLTVAGKINAREVKVFVAAGADYVFDNNYDLPSLKSIENYISTNHHLPGITPASDMETNGIEVGDLNIKLLQKIEELTLYLIKQEKEINQLKLKLKDN